MVKVNAFDRKNATDINTTYRVLSEIGWQVWLPGETAARLAIGAGFGIPTIAAGDGTATATDRITWESAGLWKVRNSLIAEATLGVREAGDTYNKVTLAIVGGVGALLMGDPSTGAVESIVRNTAGVWILNDASLQASTHRRTVTKTADFTWALSERDAVINYNHATVAGVATIPPNASVAFPIGQELKIHQNGAAGVTVTAGAGVTLRHPSGTSATLATQYGFLSYRQDSANVWVLIESSVLANLGAAPINNPTFTGVATSPVWATSGITGAVNPSRYVGAVTSGAPSSGTFAVGDWVISTFGSLAAVLVCVTAGTPGTWAQSGGGAYQPLDADLTTLAGLTATTDNFIVSVSSAWASRTPAQVRTTLGLVVGTNVQAWDADLDTWATKTAPSGTVVGTTDTQTLTNKTLTAPIIATISNTGTLTLPTSTDTLVGKATTDTLTNKTLTSPVVNTPTGIAKGDVGLGNVDNTSNATERAATATLTNKTLTAPVVNSPTGIVKGDVGLGNVDNTADASKTFNASAITAGTMATARLGSGTANSSSFLRGDQTWAAPAGGGGGDLLAANNLSDVASIATARTNLGLPTRTATTASSATPTPNADTTDIYTITAQAASAAFAAPTGSPVQGQELVIRIKDDGTARALTWDAVYRNQSTINTLPSTTVVGRTHYFHFVYNSTDTKWDQRLNDTYDKAGVDFLLAGKAPSNPLTTDTVWAAAGDVLIGTGNDTGTRLAVATVAGQALVADPHATNKISFNNPLSVSDAFAGTSGCLASTYPRWMPSSATANTQTGGTLYLYGIYLPKGFTVTTLTFWAGTTAGASNTHSWAGLYNPSRVNLAISADDTTAAWTASALRSFAMTTPYLTTASNMFYIGLCIVGGTIPTIESITGLLTAGSRAVIPRPDITTTLTGNTTPVTTTPAAAATATNRAYCEIT